MKEKKHKYDIQKRGYCCSTDLIGQGCFSTQPRLYQVLQNSGGVWYSSMSDKEILLLCDHFCLQATV